MNNLSEFYSVVKVIDTRLQNKPCYDKEILKIISSMVKPKSRINMPCSDVNCKKQCQILYNLSDDDKKVLEKGMLIFDIDVSIMCRCLDDDHCTFMLTNESSDACPKSAKNIDYKEHITIVVQTRYNPSHSACWKCCQCRED